MPCPRPYGEATFQTCLHRSHCLCPDPSECCGPCGCGGLPCFPSQASLAVKLRAQLSRAIPNPAQTTEVCPSLLLPGRHQLSPTHLLTMPPTATGPGMPSLPQITLSAASKTIRQQWLQQDRGIVLCPISEVSGVCCPKLQSDQAPYLSAALCLA